MITPTAGFIVYGVHKDGLKDPLGAPFIDNAAVAQSKQTLRAAGIKLVEHDIVVASKAEARVALKRMNRVGGGDEPPPLTPPDMRGRIRRFVEKNAQSDIAQ